MGDIIAPRLGRGVDIDRVVRCVVTRRRATGQQQRQNYKKTHENSPTMIQSMDPVRRTRRVAARSRISDQKSV